MKLISLRLPVVMLCWMVVGGAGLQAQDAAGLEIAEVSGKLQAAVGFQIKFKAEDGKDYMAVVNPQETTFRYQGTADLKFLTPGLLLRFTAPFDKAGNVSAPLKEIEVFNQVRQRRMRVEQMQDQTPGIYPVVKKDDAPAPPAGFEDYRIVGNLAGIQGEKMQIAAGNRPLMVDFAPDMVIRVNSTESSFCAEGDEIKVTGLKYPAQENWIQAESILVTGAKPLAPPEKKARATRNTKRDPKPAQANPADKK